MATDLDTASSAVDLIPGDPGVVDQLAARLSALAGGLQETVGKLQAIQAGAWVGPTGDAFRSLIHQQPSRFAAAGSAFDEAASAVRAYSRVLADAQGDADQALRLHRSAAQSSAQWHSAQSAYQTAAQQATTAGTTPPPAPSASDPGAAGRGQAEQLVIDARASVLRAAQAASARLVDACHGAPHRPGFWSHALHDVGHFAEGLADVVVDTVTFVWSLSAEVLIDPVKFVHNYENLAKGLEYGVTHPVAFGKAILDWDEWKKDPSRALGHLVGNILLAVATGGGGEAGFAARGVASMSKMTALERVGLQGSDVAALSEKRAAEIMMRGARPKPGDLGNVSSTRGPRLDYASSYADKNALNTFAGKASKTKLNDRFLANLHQSSDALGDGRSLRYGGSPKEVLATSGDHAAREQNALLREWYVKPRDGVYHPEDYLPRDEVTVIHVPASASVPAREGAIGPQVGEAIPDKVPGGNLQVLPKYLQPSWAVWTGPAPWVPAYDVRAFGSGAAATTLLGEGGSVVQRAGQR